MVAEKTKICTTCGGKDGKQANSYHQNVISTLPDGSLLVFTGEDYYSLQKGAIKNCPTCGREL